MSATPIPRTLHMSLIGLRDMSIIETPPKDRMAIQTIVAKFDEKLIRTAIEMELERGGQTYFVHNRVETIYDLASKIRELVPQARIVIGHGQLPEAELERVMLSFMNHEYDVLVATSIIENGLDIPLANTIVINRADRHGLSELYQLRGRVGRSNRRAYAYLLIPPETELTEIARRRLAALKEFSDLGAGFKIAALDLELRGAGNMLGGEQSGHIEAVGFEMYTSMLEEAVRKIKGEEEKPAHAGTSINLGISVRIDSSYIPEENQRLRMYKRIAGAEDEASLADVRAELQDRYGDPPESVLNLLAAGSLRLLCERLGIAQLDRKRTQVELPRPSVSSGGGPQHTMLTLTRKPQATKPAAKVFVEMLHIRFAAAAADTSQLGGASLARTMVDPAAMMKLVSRNAKRGAQFTPQGVLRWPLTSAKAQDVLAETRTLLESLSA
jgi:transcription-repair coupling factor (superfamily II helicase)